MSNDDNEQVQKGTSSSLCLSGFYFALKDLQPGESLPKEKLDEQERLLAAELNELSFEERMRVLEEIHGVANSGLIDETSELVEQALKDLTTAISKIRKRSAYDMALFLSPIYVCDRKFRLKFLRAEHMNAKRAACRITKYFEIKLELWGEQNLVKNITLEDFDEQDMKTFMSGSVQIIKSDVMGRPIFFCIPTYFTYSSTINMLRVLWYQVMACLEEEYAQRAGLVDIIYHVSPSESRLSFTDLILNSYKLRDSLPYRLVALHYCYDLPTIKQSMSLLRLAVGRTNRLRFRAHNGTHLECQYDLQTFGIPRKILPIDTDGNLIPSVFEEYLQERRDKESNTAADEGKGGIVRPNPNDVLLGRGRPFQQYAGNILLANIRDRYIADFKRASRLERPKVVAKVVNEIHERGGRFLQRGCHKNGTMVRALYWIKIEDPAIVRGKVAHAFRAKCRFDKLNVSLDVEHVVSEDDELPYEGGGHGEHDASDDFFDDDNDVDGWSEKSCKRQKFI